MGFWFLYYLFSFFICGIILISLWLHHRDMLKNKMFFTLKESKSLKVPSGRMILLMMVFLLRRLIHAFYCQLITYFIMSKSYIHFWVFEHFIWKMYAFEVKTYNRLISLKLLMSCARKTKKIEYSVHVPLSRI